MTFDELLANWQRLKGKAQAEWGRLTSDDLAAVEGQRERLIGKVRERYALSKEEAQKRVDAWLDRI